MGKSVKKTPIIKDNGKGKKKDKALANRATRRKLKDPDFSIPDGKSYKKEYESYRIADYVCRWTKEEAIEEYNKISSFIDKQKYPTLESFLNYWKKCMLRK